VLEPLRSTSLLRTRYVSVDHETWPAIGERDVVRVFDAAAVLPLTPDHDVLLIRQFRPAVRKDVVEIPAGLLDEPGETPDECVARELFEETGFRHSSLTKLCEIHPSPGSWTERVHLFLAETDAAATGEPERGIELVRTPYVEAVAQARAGRIEDAKTALALLLADARHDRG
jgi:8-oxo-dGTP pyrophosphatase MutT (NUDIX family)